MAGKILKKSELVIGTTMQGYMLATGIVERKSTKPNSNAFWCDVELTDGKDKIKAKIWNETKDTIGIAPDTVVGVEIRTDDFQGEPSYVICRVCTADCEAIGLKPADFAIKAPMDSEDMYNELIEIVRRSVDNKIPNTLAELVINIFENNKEAILKSSAAESIHHNMYGGLLWHTLRMARLAEVIVDTYPSVNRELVISATICHDIGKLVELETNALGVAKYTIDGQLFGHAYIGMRMVEEEANKGQYDSEKVRCLRHCIASHHGKLDWGAITLPQTLEASVLHHIDLIDSRIQQFETQYESMEPGTCSDSKVFGLDNVKVYKPKFSNDVKNKG